MAWSEFAVHQPWHFTRFRSDATMISDTPCLWQEAVNLSVVPQQNDDVIVAWGNQWIPLSFERVHITP